MRRFEDFVRNLEVLIPRFMRFKASVNGTSYVGYSNVIYSSGVG